MALYEAGERINHELYGPGEILSHEIIETPLKWKNEITIRFQSFTKTFDYNTVKEYIID